jgi:hypothetical protein
MKRTLKTVLLSIFVCLTTHLSAQTDIIINPNGGSSSQLDDGLKIVIATSRGSLHVYRENLAQYCCGADYPKQRETNSVQMTFRFESNNVLNSTAKTYTNCSVTPAQLSVNDWTASMAGHVTSSISGKKFYVTVKFSYTYPNKYFTVDYYVRAPLDLVTPETVHLYLDHDAYILGHDASRGYTFKDSNGHIVGDYRNVGDDFYCQAGNSSPRYPSHHGFKVSDTFRSYYSDERGNRAVIDSKTLMLGNKISQGKCVDDGIAVEFLLFNANGSHTLSAGQTGVRRVLHCYGDVKGEFEKIPVINPSIPQQISSKVDVSFSDAQYTEKEGPGDHITQNIKIRVAPTSGTSGYLMQDQVCSFSISGGTAVQNTDYTYQTGFIIPAGDYSTPKELVLDNVRILDNTLCHADKTFDIEILANDCNDLLNITGTKKATVTIEDDERLSQTPLTVTISAHPGFLLCEKDASSITFTAHPSTNAFPATYVWKVDSMTIAGNSSDTFVLNLNGVRKARISCTMTLNACTPQLIATDEKDVRISSCVIPANPHRRGKIK